MSVTLTGNGQVFQATESAFPQLTLNLKTAFSRTQEGTMRTIERADPDYTIILSFQIISLQQRQDLEDFVSANASKIFTYFDDITGEVWSVRLISDPSTVTLQDKSLNTISMVLQGNQV